MARRVVLAACILAGAAAAHTFGQAANVAVTVTVDAAAGRRPIDPRIYGVAHASAAALTDLRSPLNGWGGNSTTRYNWQQNADNRANDWYYQSIGYGSAVAGEGPDTFIAQSRGAAAEPMFTVPMVGWVAKVGPGRSKLASFSIARYGAQAANDWQWFPDAGNGVRAGGGFVTGNDPNDANVPSDGAFQQGHVQHLVSRWGTAASGGLRYYVLDNEPSIWHSTHRDVHPAGATMEELRDKILDYGGRVKAVDPTALVVAPEEWGWTGYLYSGYDQQWGSTHGWSQLPDRTGHGNADYLPWLLDQLQRRQTASGRRIVDVFSVHYYPQGGEYGDDVSTAMQLRRNRSTRSLWDPAYTDETWIAAQVRLVPRLREWVDRYYPGTKTGLTEYNWGAEGHINGATAQADILGIFGREGLDMAARWTTPAASTPTYKAMKLYRNYDGQGRGFGDTSVSARVPDPDALSAFAGLRATDGALTVMVVNKALSAGASLTLALSGFAPGAAAQAWQLTSANAITRLADVPVAGDRLTATLPAQSVTLLVVPAAAAAAVTRYVDPLLATASCTSYNPTTRACAGGTAPAYKTLAGAAAATAPGDTVLIRAGTYNQPLAPTISGIPGQPIVYKAHPGEQPTIRDLGSPALLLENVSNVVIEGLAVVNVQGWARIVDSTEVVLRNNTFSAATATGTTGGIKIVRGGRHRILDNTIADGNDDVSIVQSDRNLVAGNTISRGRHTVWRILCGNNNVIRNNTFSNPIQKIGEVLDCEGGSDVPVLLDSTKRNLVENNVFDTTAPDDGGGPYSGIQYAGQNGIVRRNRFFNVQGGAVSMANYADEALNNRANRIYHNVFYRNAGGGTLTENTGIAQFGDNLFKNNAYFRNTPAPIHWNDNQPGGSQVTNRVASGFRFENNSIMGAGPGETTVWIAGALKTLAAAQSQNPTLYAGNLEANPGFVNAEGRDFRLGPGSPLVDAGGFLTRTRSAGSGTSLPVQDASWFYDGYEIAGEAGDLVQVQGQAQTARVVDIDYANNVLVLDRALSWSAAQGVALAYSGAAPDIGAFESAGGGPSDTVPPTVALTAPAGGALVSGTLAVTATAADNIGVVGVQFKLDGNNLGSEDVAAPYTVSWNTAQAPNGSHTLTVVARDAAGNAATSAAVAVTVANGVPSITIDDRSVPEGGAANAAFRVYLSAPSTQTVTVAYSTANGSATAGNDYTAVSGTLTFTPGRVYHSVYVPILPDPFVEGPETFTVNLGSPVNAVLVRAQATGTIESAPIQGVVPMYRTYNMTATYHFFTTSAAEKDNAVAHGYRDEGVAFKVRNTLGMGCTALFRMYNPNNGRHYYTANPGERDSLMGVGLVYEKDEACVYTAALGGAVEVFRLYNRRSGAHLYTPNRAEKDFLVTTFPGVWEQHQSLGWALP